MKNVRFNLGNEAHAPQQGAAPASPGTIQARQERQFRASFSDWCKVHSHIVRSFMKDERGQWWSYYTKDCERAVFLMRKLLDKHRDVEITNASESDEFYRIALRWRVTEWIKENHHNLSTLSSVVTQAFFQDRDYDWLVEVVSNQNYTEEQRADELCHVDNYERLARIASKLDELKEKIDTLSTQYSAYIPKLMNYVATHNDFLMAVRRNELPDRFVNYVTANPVSLEFVRALHGHLIQFSDQDYSVRRLITDNRFDTDELVYLLVAGLRSWRLDMLTRICSYDTDEVVQALTFEELHRTAISDYLQIDQVENHWQNVSAKSRQLVDQYFSTLNAGLLNRNAVDVSRVWYAAAGRIKAQGSVYTPLARLNILGMNKQERGLYVSSFASAKKCYDDAMKNDDYTFSDNGMLNVEPDILLWLFLRHRDNSIIVSFINANSQIMQPIFTSYAQPIPALDDAMGDVLDEAMSAPAPSPSKRIKTESVAEEIDEVEEGTSFSIRN